MRKKSTGTRIHLFITLEILYFDISGVQTIAQHSTFEYTLDLNKEINAFDDASLRSKIRYALWIRKRIFIASGQLNLVRVFKS